MKRRTHDEPLVRNRVLVFALSAVALGACRADLGFGDLVGDVGSGTATVGGSWVKIDGPKCAPTPAVASPGHVVFRLPTQRMYRIEARPGAAPHDLSHELDALSKGLDAFANVSPDGEWLVLQTSRFGCG